ncbi:MAG: MFS transporter [Deltaproteobacteria bacterium]|nr:MFS transporter [Deltaproteobacteria bacterium]MBW2016556.1 MFS transporter [Deltaproteobacteria bacterium]MBW2130035.1 MFS transporter [Deltaproteobacteria bacterium]
MATPSSVPPSGKGDPSGKEGRRFFQTPYVWAFTTYFAEGFPYTVIRIISSVFFRDMRVSLEAIGLTSLFGLPWVLKFLWGPQVDRYATKRRWMLIMQALLVAMVILAAFFAGAPAGVSLIAGLFFVGAFVAATHDIAIDGYYMEALDRKGQAKFVGYRVMAYRIAMMTGTGVIITIGARIDWTTGFLCAGLLLALLFTYHILFLPRVETEKAPFGELIKGFLRVRPVLTLLALAALTTAGWWVFSLPWYGSLKSTFPVLKKIRFAGWVGIGLLLALILLTLFKERIKGLFLRDRDSFYSRAFLAYMDREKMGAALAFIILMRTGESMLASMASPFMVDLGIKVHYGWISGGIGLPFSILGAMIGGWMISRYSLRKTLWPFLLAQNLTNLVYMGLALYLAPYVRINTGAEHVLFIGNFNLFLVAVVHAFDQFAGGLGTSVLATYLMRTCLSEFKAAHFAIGTGLMNISGVLSGVVSGFLAGWLGYGYFFGISFVASVPGMLLIFFIPFLDAEGGRANVDA